MNSEPPPTSRDARARASWWDDAKIGPHLAQTLAKEGQNHSGISRVGGVGAEAGAGPGLSRHSPPLPGELNKRF